MNSPTELTCYDKNNKNSLADESILFIKHKLISWLNHITNQSTTFYNMDNVVLDAKKFTNSIYAPSININLTEKNGRGTMYFHYNNNGELVDIHLLMSSNTYENTIDYPTSANLFGVEINIDKEFKIKDYLLKREIKEINTIHGFHVRYYFSKDNKKIKEEIAFTQENVPATYNDNEQLSSVEFDDFFNGNIKIITKSQDVFFELYPNFSINKIENNNDTSLFYKELKQFYQDGIFNKSNSFEENLEVLKMVAI